MGSCCSTEVEVEGSWLPEPPSELSCGGVEFGFQYYCFFGEWKKRKDEQWNEQWIDIYKVFASKEAKAPEKIVMLHIQQRPVYEHTTNYKIKNKGATEAGSSEAETGEGSVVGSAAAQAKTTESAFLYFKGSAGGKESLPDGWVITNEEPSKESTEYWAYCESEEKHPDKIVHNPGKNSGVWIVAVGNDKVESGAEEKNWRANKSLKFEDKQGAIEKKQRPIFSTTTTVTYVPSSLWTCYSSNDGKLLEKLLEKLRDAKQIAGWEKAADPTVSYTESGKYPVLLGRMKVQVAATASAVPPSQPVAAPPPAAKAAAKPPAAKPKAASKAEKV